MIDSNVSLWCTTKNKTMLNLISWIFYGIPLKDNEDLQFDDAYTSLMVVAFGVTCIVFIIVIVSVLFF